MRAERILGGLWMPALFTVLFLQAVPPSGDSCGKDPEFRETRSLIRMELLAEKEETSGRVLRNIFSPQAISGRGGVFDPSQFPAPADEPGAPREEKPRPAISLKYVGYIDSDRKTVGLIIFEGEALAVEEGEILRMGIRVGRISPEGLEIIGPDSEKRIFPLEGDRG